MNDLFIYTTNITYDIDVKYLYTIKFINTLN